MCESAVLVCPEEEGLWPYSIPLDSDDDGPGDDTTLGELLASIMVILIMVTNFSPTANEGLQMDVVY